MTKPLPRPVFIYTSATDKQCPTCHSRTVEHIEDRPAMMAHCHNCGWYGKVEDLIGEATVRR